MAFFSKVGNILRQTASKQINSDLSASTPSLFQAIRCMSSSKLFVGGISYATDDQSLKEAFAQYGEVIEARVIMDRETGRSRGFGFITYTSSEEASSAIQALDGSELHGRRVRVNYAADRPRPSFGGGGGYGGGGFGGGAYGGGGYGGGGGGYGGNEGGGYNSGYGGGGDRYGGGGGNFSNEYGSGGGGGNYGGAGGGSYGSTGNYGGSNFGVAGGAGGNDSHVGDTGGGDSFANGNGFGGSTGTDFGVGSDQFGSNAANGMDDNSGGLDQVGPLEGNFRDVDDDEPDDFAKRA